MDIVLSITKIVLASELDEAGLRRFHIATRLGIGRATLYRWLDGIKKAGSVEGYINPIPEGQEGAKSQKES